MAKWIMSRSDRGWHRLQDAGWQDSVLASLHLTLLHSFGIEAKNFNGVTDKSLSGLAA